MPLRCTRFKRLLDHIVATMAPPRAIHLLYSPGQRPTPKPRSFVAQVIAAFGQ